MALGLFCKIVVTSNLSLASVAYIFSIVPAYSIVYSTINTMLLSGCNPKQKNFYGFTPRLLAKEKSFKEASKELRKAERTFTKYSKPGMKNPNEPEVLYLYDWTCERAEIIRDRLMQMVGGS